MTGQERRLHPRVNDETLSLTLNTGGFDTVTHTMNISASGLYCKLDREIPLMSRVKVVLMLPDPMKEGKAKSMEVEGVIVREHPVIIDGKIKHYDAAIFFDSLSSKDREVITQYIARKKS
ncbi:MAG: PilZ domain-containing protein [Candidatus Omnitrophica bacterium]|nr:PilZ domain-containing protein [Candidatus Omnitrophota bacterium]